MMIPLLIFLLSFGRFTGAVDLDYDVAGNIYVVDRTANMLVKLSPRGDSLRAVSGFGDGEMQFDGPVALHARRGNDIYVADYNNHRIQRFNRTLDYITTISTRDDPDERKRFGYPRDVAVTRQGDLLIVDGENRRIIKINSFGAVERAFGDMAAGEGRLVDPSKIEVDEDDNIYVLDGKRIIQFDPFGSYVRDISTFMHEKEEILSISVDRDTLVIGGRTDLAMLDLKTNEIAGYYNFEGHPTAFRSTGGRIIALEPERVMVFARPGE